MSDPFAAGLATLHGAAGSVAAVYRPDDGDPIAIRVVRSRPDALASFEGAQLLDAHEAFSIRVADVPAPDIGDVVEVDGQSFVITVDPIGDAEGLSWTCAARRTA